MSSSTAGLAPPTPIHHIRHHTHSVSALCISTDNERLYTADASGRVVCSSTRSLRAIANWQAHTDSVLGVEEVGSKLVTQGRDHKLYIWSRPERRGAQIAGGATLKGETPDKLDEMDVNALNYCRFSVISDVPAAASPSQSKDGETGVLIALPNLVESAHADVWRLQGQERIHAAVGKRTPFKSEHMDGRGQAKTGIIMSLHLLPAHKPGCTRLLVGYESGSVLLWMYDPALNQNRCNNIEGLGWTVLREWKIHVETVISLAAADDCSFALSVSADHLIGKYDLLGQDGKAETVRAKHPGNASVALRAHGRVCAVGGWDGRIRLYSTKSFKSLGTLLFHRKSVERVVFARPNFSSDEEDEDEDGYILTSREKEARSRWLVSGDMDGKVAVWELDDFVHK